MPLGSRLEVIRRYVPLPDEAPDAHPGPGFSGELQGLPSMLRSAGNTPVLEIFPDRFLRRRQYQSAVFLTLRKHRNKTSVLPVFHRSVVRIQTCRNSQTSRCRHKQNLFRPPASNPHRCACRRRCNQTASFLLRPLLYLLIDFFPQKLRLFTKLYSLCRAHPFQQRAPV